MTFSIKVVVSLFAILHILFLCASSRPVGGRSKSAVREGQDYTGPSEPSSSHGLEFVSHPYYDSHGNFIEHFSGSTYDSPTNEYADNIDFDSLEKYLAEQQPIVNNEHQERIDNVREQGGAKQASTSQVNQHNSDADFWNQAFEAQPSSPSSSSDQSYTSIPMQVLSKRPTSRRQHLPTPSTTTSTRSAYVQSMTKNDRREACNRYSLLTRLSYSTCLSRINKRYTDEVAINLFSNDPKKQGQALHELALARDGDLINMDERRIFESQLADYWGLSQEKANRLFRTYINLHPEALELLRSGNKESFNEAAALLGPRHEYPQTRSRTRQRG